MAKIVREARQNPRFSDAIGGAFIIHRYFGLVLSCVWLRSRFMCCPTIYRGDPALNERLICLLESKTRLGRRYGL